MSFFKSFCLAIFVAVSLLGQTGPGVGSLFTNTNPGKISGNFTANLTGFQPTPAYSQLSVGPTSSRVALPSGLVVIVYNTGANAAFVTLGNSTVTATVGNTLTATRARPSGAMAALSTLGALPDASGSSAVSINHAGQAVGNSAFGGETFATEWSGGSILKLEGPSQTTATGINDAGQVVGTSFFIGPYFATATDWIGGSAVYLQNLPGATESVAFGIKNAGQVVGESFIGGIGVATERSGGSVINLARSAPGHWA
jgi:uncharacterized membrane protein